MIETQIRRAGSVDNRRRRGANGAYPGQNPSQTQINESRVPSGFPGEHKDSHKDWEEHMCPNDFEGEIEEKDAMCVGANVSRRYPCL